MSSGFFVRIAESAEDTEDAEGTLGSPIFDILSESRKARRTRRTRKGFFHISGLLSQVRLILAKTLFLRVLCVLCALRDSDSIRVQYLPFLCLKRGSYPRNTLLTSEPFYAGCTYKTYSICMLVDISSIWCFCDGTAVRQADYIWIL